MSSKRKQPHAEPARPFDSKPSWRGVYYVNGRERYVANSAGGLILYASAEAAEAAATFLQEAEER